MTNILIDKQYGLQNKQSSLTRGGDWQCLNCCNLNFSFRKKCNRCKTQTRQQNDNNLFYLYQCYQQHYNGPNKEFPINQLNQELIEQISNQILPLITQFPLNVTYQESALLILPSVSPIIKRYKIQKSSQKTLNKQSQNSQNQYFQCQKQFLHQYCWKNLLIDEQVQKDMVLFEQNQVWDYQIQKIVQNIII